MTHVRLHRALINSSGTREASRPVSLAVRRRARKKFTQWPMTNSIRLFDPFIGTSSFDKLIELFSKGATLEPRRGNRGGFVQPTFPPFMFCSLPPLPLFMTCRVIRGRFAGKFHRPALSSSAARPTYGGARSVASWNCILLWRREIDPMSEPS